MLNLKKEQISMKISKTKSTKRFNFNINRNFTSHVTGGNTFTISTDVDFGRYGAHTDGSTTSMTMTVKEARAMYKFLGEYIGGGTSTETGTTTS
jgi:hypothetical protein